MIRTSGSMIGGSGSMIGASGSMIGGSGSMGLSCWRGNVIFAVSETTFMNCKHVVTYVIGLMILTATAVSAGAQTVMDGDRRSNSISADEEHAVNENKTLMVTEEEPDNVTDKETHKVTHKVMHRVTAEVRPVVNMPTHGFYRGYNDMGKAVPYAGSAHLKYSFSLSPESRLGQLYPTAYQGVGVAVHSFFNHDLTGTPVIMYLFQGSRLADLSPNISFDYEWNLGASYGWKVNEVVGSRWNIYINVGLPFTWHANPKCDISFGPEYTHFSNGDTTFPNGGANTVGLRLGVTWKITPNGSAISSKSAGQGVDMAYHGEGINTTGPGVDMAYHREGINTTGTGVDMTYHREGINTTGPGVDMTYHGEGSHTENNSWDTMEAPGRLLIQGEPELQSKKAAERMSYDLFIYGAWRADRYLDGFHLEISNEHHAVAGITFNPLYRLNRYFSVGPGLDIMYDTSADINGETPTLPFIRQTACGVSAKAELTMPYFSINLGAGYNVLNMANDLKGFYTTYNLKIFLSQKMFLTMGYRLGSVNYAHNLMFGVGVRM